MRAIAYVLAGLLAAAAIVVIGVKVRDALHAPTPRARVGPTLFLQTPVLTPLPRDSGPRNNQRPRTLPSPKTRPAPQTVSRNPRNRSVTVHKRRTPRTKRDRRRTRPAGQQQPQPSNPPPSQPQPPKPPVCLNAPVPLTVTTPVAGVNVC